MLAQRLLMAAGAGAPIPLITYPSSRLELFLDNEDIETLSGLTTTIQTPTKYASNPVFLPAGVNSDTWDYSKSYLTVRKEGALWRMWYQGSEFTSPYNVRNSYATSTDGISWTKPNLGLVSYGGNSSNNIFMDASSSLPSLYYDAAAPADRRYLMLIAHKPGSSEEGIYLYKSATGDPGDWIHVKDIATHTTHGAELLGEHIARLPDGRWAAYYQDFRNARREISAYVSATDNLSGSWSDIGILISAAGTSDEKYSIGVEKMGDVYVAWVPVYNSPAQLTSNIHLYISRDGLTWTLLQSGWLTTGAGGAWDDSGIYNSFGLVQDGSDWRYYYVGSPTLHDSVPGDLRHGFATLGYRRLAGVGTTGTLITAPLTLAGDLMVNADASSGSLDIELLDAATGVVLLGFAQADFDTITINAFGSIATWGGSSAPIGANVKLKFTLTDATLHSYWLN